MGEVLAEYLAKREAATDPRFEDAIELQLRIDEAEKILADERRKLNTMLAELAKEHHPNYVVTDMREFRKLRPELVKTNFPDVYEQAAPSDKWLITCLFDHLGRDNVLELAQYHDPDGYEAHREITLKEFDAMTGDSSAKKKYRGVAYDCEWKPSGQPHVECVGKPLMMQAPSRARIEPPNEDEDE